MFLPTPIPPEGYPISPTNPTSVTFWQGVLDSLHGRLVDLKDQVTVTIESLGDDATALALELVANSVAPVLAEVQQEMVAIQAAIALAQDQLAAIQQGAVVAENVSITPIDGVVGLNAQAALAELAAAVAGANQALSIKADKADTFTKTEVTTALDALKNDAYAHALFLGDW